MNNFIQRRLRIYCAKANEDVNIKIANGIESAAVVLVFPSPSLQVSKTGSKLLNYADQTKAPILTIKTFEDFQCIGWLGAILAPTKSCSTNFDEVMKSVISMEIKTSSLVLERDEKNEPQPIKEFLFCGGTKSGDLTARKVIGQGDDTIGAFTLAGEYQLTDDSGSITMQKQYIGKHSVIYQGNISFQKLTCVIEGYWNIDEMHDKFFIHLTLSKAYTSETKMIKPPKVSHRQGSKVMISYCSCQYDLAQKLVKGLIARRIPVVCPSMNIHEMIKIATQEARVVLPLMSEAYEASQTAKYLMSYVDEAGIPIIPIKTQANYSQSGWLGVICAAALFIKMTNTDNFEQKLNSLAEQLHPYISDSRGEDQKVETLVDETLAQGYYIQNGEKFDMTFDLFVMTNGYIADEGNDEIGSFVINGKYTRLSGTEDLEFQFKKHYIGRHDVQYSGIITHDKFWFFFDGKWLLNKLSDSFHLEVSRKQSSKSECSHIMLSYQWNSQAYVKRIASMLKQKNIPIWFDIAGDMKGNINTAMATGVEGAALIISFDTVAYSKSINCQKEFTYALQLKKNIVPVLLEHVNNLQNTWLGNSIASLNTINMQDESQFDSSFKALLQRINIALKEKEVEDSDRSQVITRFEGGIVTGKYCQYGQDFDMVFDFFSLREGRVSGQGNDTIAPFTMAGYYDNEGKVCFTKQYVGKHAVIYKGNLTCDNMGGFKIEGKWNIDDLTDYFCLESVSSTKSDTPKKNK
ncbi:unnamed protein product [Rotaria sp. Silwood1]|nr:unnamed protein product [Rotaria sp. Silwood1]